MFRVDKLLTSDFFKKAKPVPLKIRTNAVEKKSSDIIE